MGFLEGFLVGFLEGFFTGTTARAELVDSTLLVAAASELPSSSQYHSMPHL